MGLLRVFTLWEVGDTKNEHFVGGGGGGGACVFVKDLVYQCTINKKKG